MQIFLIKNHKTQFIEIVYEYSIFDFDFDFGRSQKYFFPPNANCKFFRNFAHFLVEFLMIILLPFQLGKVVEKAACRSVFLTIWHCVLSPELTKTIDDFAHWGYLYLLHPLVR